MKRNKPLYYTAATLLGILAVMATVEGQGQPPLPEPGQREVQIDASWQASVDNVSTAGQIAYHLKYYDAATTQVWLSAGTTTGTTSLSFKSRFQSDQILLAVNATDAAGNSSAYTIPIVVPIPDIHPPQPPQSMDIVVRVVLLVSN